MNYEKKYIKYKKKYLNLKNNMRGSSDPLKKYVELANQYEDKLIENQAAYKKEYDENLDEINAEENETKKLFLILSQRIEKNKKIKSHLPIKDHIKEKKPYPGKIKFEFEDYDEYIQKIFKNLIEQEISDEDKFYIKELFEILTPHYNLFFDWFDYLEKKANFENLEENNNKKKLEKIYEENYMKKLKNIYFEDNPSNLYFDLLELSIEKSKDLENISDAGNIIYNYFKEIAIDPSKITNSQIIEKIENRHKFIDDVFEGGRVQQFKLNLIANTIKQDEDEINNLQEEEKKRINALRIDDLTKEKFKEKIKKKYPYPYPLFHRDSDLIYQYDYDKLIKEGVKLDQLKKYFYDRLFKNIKGKILRKLTNEMIEKVGLTKKKEYIEAIRDEEVKKELYKKLYDVKLCETTENKPEPSKGRKNRIKEEENGKLKFKFKDNRSKLEITLKNKIKKYDEYFSIEGENFCMLKNGHFFEKIDEGKDLFGEDKEKLESIEDKVVKAVYLFFYFDLIVSVENKDNFKQYLIDKDFTKFTEIKEEVKKYLPTSPPSAP